MQKSAVFRSLGSSPPVHDARGQGLKGDPLVGPLGFDFAQHRQTLRPSVDGIRSEALRPFGHAENRDGGNSVTEPRPVTVTGFRPMGCHRR